jgi:hypothetical protein
MAEKVGLDADFQYWHALFMQQKQEMEMRQ